MTWLLIIFICLPVGPCGSYSTSVIEFAGRHATERDCAAVKVAREKQDGERYALCALEH